MSVPLAHRHAYLFKGLEDLHLDERVMQFLSVVNNMLLSRSVLLLLLLFVVSVCFCSCCCLLLLPLFVVCVVRVVVYCPGFLLSAAVWDFFGLFVCFMLLLLSPVCCASTILMSSLILIFLSYQLPCYSHLFSPKPLMQQI